jgi:hypothetical protein
MGDIYVENTVLLYVRLAYFINTTIAAGVIPSILLAAP